ncbi:MAG: hypothetical protein ACRDID_03345, partial [Ktedonobacterales bacterium]
MVVMTVAQVFWRRQRMGTESWTAMAGKLVAKRAKQNAAHIGEKAGWVASQGDRVEGAPRTPPVALKAVDGSGEFLGQGDDDAR